MSRARYSTTSRILYAAGAALLIAGLVGLGWIAYQYFGADAAARDDARKAEQELHRTWETAKPGTSVSPSTGMPLAILRIPRLGDDWKYPVIEGVDTGSLGKGVGHFPNTALPGQLGNFAIAGHRITHGSPFKHVLDLRQGDHITVETAAGTYDYVVDTAPKSLTVHPDDGWVLQPDPQHPGAKPTRRLLTLITCQDFFHSPDRSVAFAHLVKTIPRQR